MNVSQSTRGVPSIGAAGKGVVRSAPFEWLSRAGFVARATVYAVIGILALKLAFGQGGKLTDQQGALHTVANQPFGTVLLTLVAIGLAGYSLWRLVRAVLGHGPEGSDSGFDRVAAGASGIAYGAMCAVGIAGAGMLGVAAYQGYRGVTKKFLEDSKVEEMRPGTRRWISRIGIVGHLARMVVFGLIGIFLIKAAADYDPRAAVGLDGALAKLQGNSYGPVLLGVVAAGLIAFALYSLSDARYRRI